MDPEDLEQRFRRLQLSINALDIAQEDREREAEERRVRATWAFVGAWLAVTAGGGIGAAISEDPAYLGIGAGAGLVPASLIALAVDSEYPLVAVAGTALAIAGAIAPGVIAQQVKMGQESAMQPGF